MADNSGASNVISLPKGGGAQAGLGEKFSPDLHTGTGNFTVPISLPPGRNGFQPQLNLVYSTGQGNGPFGLGWSLSIPGVTRKSSKRIPRYLDNASDRTEHDTFILSGAEDLVPVDVLATGGTRYRPRTEGLFAQIERRRDAGNDFWVVRSKDGLVSLYGTENSKGSDPAVIIDPSDGTHDKIFAWKLTRTVDPFGNLIQYEYDRDRGQEGARSWDQLYLRRIQYANYEHDGEQRFLISVSVDYEDRPDPFSEYRSGFEIRTRKRCRSITIHTHAGQDYLARTYSFVYLDARPELVATVPLNGMSLLSQIVVKGHDHDAVEMMPPLEFGYSTFDPLAHNTEDVQGAGLPSTSLANPNLELVDLFGQGLPDILEMSSVTVRYWRNLGNGQFGFPQAMDTAPSGLALSQPGVQLLDANGNGRLDLLVTKPTMTGYFPLRFGGLWDNSIFRPYPEAPSVDLKNPQVRLLDLDGDGVTDAMYSGSGADLLCYLNDPLKGWGSPLTVARPAEFPTDFTDPRLKWGDMSGDALQDAVSIHGGNVTYFPNLGYGKWGNAVLMSGILDLPADYNPKRLLLGDIDGDGLADLVYVDSGTITIWINKNGNAWSSPITINDAPVITDSDDVRLSDLHGTGLSSLLYSKDFTGLGSNLSLLRFQHSVKPYLLTAMDNHIGAVTKIHYESSVQFYLKDQADSTTAWRTVLPFPVQVVSRVEVIDELSRGKKTTQYQYHDGYWDGVDREFRGFGMVEQYDSESFDEYDRSGLHGNGVSFSKVPVNQFSSPTLTKTWFHQGLVGDDDEVQDEAERAAGYWTGDPSLLEQEKRIKEYLVPFEQSAKRDALRTLRGSVLRTELFALDGSEREARPYTVTESQYELREIEPPGADNSERSRIFYPHVTATRTTQWERGNDPMTQFAFTRYTNQDKKFDAFGRPLVQTTVACPRGWRTTTDRPVEPYLSTSSRTVYATPLSEEQYIHTRVSTTTTYEHRHTENKQLNEVAVMVDAPEQLRLIGHGINYYDGDAFVGLPVGQVGRFGALSRSDTLVLTDELLADAYGADLPPCLVASGEPSWSDTYPQEYRTLLPKRAGYVFHAESAEPFCPAGYFVMSERRRYDVQSDPSGNGYGLVLETLDPLYDPSHDPFGNPLRHRTTIAYDDYHLLPLGVTDPAGLTTHATYDYRVLQPKEVTDSNGTTTTCTFSPLGLLTSTAIRGQSNTEGDWTRPSVRMEYDFLSFLNSLPEHRTPIFVRTIRQIHHETELDVPAGERDETITTVEYSDGFGRLLQTRTQGEDVRFGDESFGGGESVLPRQQVDGAGGDVVGRQQADDTSPNVIVSGWQRYDNKGQVVEKFEPFFSQGWPYDEPAEEKLGQKVTMRYDPRGHVVRTINPDGSEQRVVYGVSGTIAVPDVSNPDLFEPTPWEAYTYDANDNAGRTHPAVAASYRHHWNTPSSILIDSLGRTIEAVVRNREPLAHPDDPLFPIREVRTRTSYDIRGNVITIKDELGREAFFDHIYDYANRKLRMQSIDAGLRATVFNAAGGVIEQRDGKGAIILHGYDDLNRPLRLWARDGQDEALTLRERIEYGDGGSSTQPEEERATNRAKYCLGKPVRHFDEAGLVEFEGYDFKGNLLQKARSVVSDQAILSVFEPPPADWKVETFRVDWSTPDAVALDPARYVSTITYDALNRIKLMTFPQDVESARRRLRPHYNRAGALERVMLEQQTQTGEIEASTFVNRIAYDAKGQRALIAYGNGIMTRYAYDARTFRLVHLRTERFSQPADLTYHPTGDPLQSLAYQYDLSGNIVTIHDRAPECGILNTELGIDALDRQFSYDALYRLSAATGRECDLPPELPWDAGPRGTDLTKTRGYREHYRYDDAGNMTELKHLANGSGFTRSFEIVGENNRLKSMTIASDLPASTQYAYAYDANGNMTLETTSRHFEWDHADRMKAFRTQTEASEPSVHAHYLYDSAGQRVKKLVRKQGGQREVTIYVDGLFEHQRIVQGDTIQENNSLHVLDNQSRVAIVRKGPSHPDDTGPAVQYHLGDHLGSSTLIVSESGIWINHEEFSPYGETSVGSFSLKRYRFTGKEREEESGLYYHGARHYASWIVKWTSCDPIGTVDGLNLYGYVRNNPVKFRDAAGTSGEVHTLPEVTVVGVPDQRSEAEVKQEIETRTGKTANNLILGLGGGPQDMSMHDLENELYGRGILKVRLEESDSKQVVADEVLTPHPYMAGRFISEMRVGSAASIDQKKEAGLEAVTASVIQGFASAAAGISPGSANPSLVGGSKGDLNGTPRTYEPKLGAYKPKLTRFGDPVGPSQLTVNRLSGDAARDQLTQMLRNHYSAQGKDWTVQSEAAGRIYLRTPYGPRYLDILVKDRIGVAVGAIEVKFGGATRNAAQELKDQWLYENIGLRVDVVTVPTLVRP